MATPYAAGTDVPVEKTRGEIEGLLSRHGAGQRGIMCDDHGGAVAVYFVVRDRKYRIDMQMPTQNRFAPQDGKEPPAWRKWDVPRRAAWVRRRWEQACRERWRALLLVLKAKLEMVRIGGSTIEREFMADLVLPDGRTVAEQLEAQVQQALEGGPAPRLLGRGTA